MTFLPPRRRAVEASKRITMGAHQATPLDYVEAIAIAEAGDRSKFKAHAAEMVVTAPDVVAAAEQILAAYFSELPRATRDGRSLDKSFEGLVEAPVPAQRQPGDNSGPVVAPSPGRPEPVSWIAGKRCSDEVARSVGELETAGQVLSEAARRSTRLRQFAVDAAKKIRTRIAYKLSAAGATSAALAIDEVAKNLADAADGVALLTMSNQPDPELALIDSAIARGAGAHEVDAITRFGRNYDELRRHGHEPSMSRERFVDINMRLWKHDNR